MALPTPLRGRILLRLSWSHLIELIRLEDPWKRAFYENECLRGSWRTTLNDASSAIVPSGNSAAPQVVHDLALHGEVVGPPVSADAICRNVRLVVR